MNNFPSRNFNCKNEELPVISGFVALSLKRDKTDFSTYSSQFNDEYIAGFNSKIEIVQELVEPKSETVQLKLINERIYGTLNALISPVN